MGSEVLLQSACELSYEIARDGVEADPPIDPPAAMRTFLYVADLPDRALAVAQQAIEDDPAFRRRVAEQAGEDDVGRAGYLWLHRPIGWAAEFEELSSTEQVGDFAANTGDFEPASAASHSLDYTIEELARDGLGDGDTAIDDGVRVAEPDLEPNTDLFGDSNGDLDYDAEPGSGAEVEVPAGAASALGFGSIDAFSNGDGGLDLSLGAEPTGRTEANAIEDELSSLRGLVDRLSSERKAVSTSVRRVEAEVETSKHQPSMFDSDIYSLQSELEAARAELDEARAERDNAVHQRSESLTRQLELEKELERSRELRADLEREHEHVDTEIVGLKESHARSEAALTNLEDEREDLKTQVADLAQTNETLNTQVAQITEDAAAESKALLADKTALQAEVDTLRSGKEDIAANLATLDTELNEAKAQLSQTGTQAAEAKSLVDALTEEKIDLASRLADTEAMLETTRAQLSAVKSDSEAVTADLSNIKAHRDGLSAQVEELHGSLSEALNDLAKVRSTSDADRAALKEVRSERDLLRVRVGSLEQIETGLEAKMANLAIERDSFIAKAEASQTELTQLQREMRTAGEEKDGLSEELATADEARSALTLERDELASTVEDLTTQTAELIAARDGLQQQVEQLNGENSSIQSQLVEAERLRVETAENQGHALSELAQRLSLVENERTRLESDLREAESRLSDALVTLEAARDDAERIRSEQADASPSPSSVADELKATLTSPPVETASVPAVVEPPSGDIAGPLPVSGDDADPTLALGFARPEAPEIDTPPPPLGDDAADPLAPEPDPEGAPQVDGEQSRSKRQKWGIGSLRRSETDDDAGTDDATGADDLPPPPPPPLVTDVELGGPPVAEEAPDAEPETAEEPAIGDRDDVAAELAERLDEEASTADADVSDAEIDSISTELAEAAGTAGLDAGDDEDLDEISNLISQTVTDFDPKSLDRPDFDEPTAGPSDEGDGKPGRARRLFGGRTDLSKRNSGPLPPSVFGDSDDDVLASLADDQAEATGTETTASFPADSAPSDSPKGGRRQIEIPAELADDEVEMARHVVSSPDVVLLVDGDSVAKMGWPSLPVAQQRDALVSYLADLSATTGAAPDVVFDGRIGEEESLPASRAVRIRLSTPPTEPAAALDELVDAYPEQWPIAIVTDDGDLGRSATERGAVVLNNGQLLDLFIA